MRPYLGPPWTNSCQIWCVRVFHHVLLKYCHENAEMQKKKIWWRHTSVLYIRGRVKKSLQPSFFSSHGCIYRKAAVSTSSIKLCLLCHVTWTVLHAWLHYGISIKTKTFWALLIEPNWREFWIARKPRGSILAKLSK